MLSPAPDSWTFFDAAHLLGRAGFGGSPAEIKALHALGRHKAVESLLSPEIGPEETALPAWAADESLRADRQRKIEQSDRIKEAENSGPRERMEGLRRTFNQENRKVERRRQSEAQTWWFNAMLSGRAPLREKMTLFWHDHFPTSVQKVKEIALLVRQNDLFRRHATGNFRALTHAVAEDPAMMLYLDSQRSVKGRPNENFAREVMELFTLGEGHYTEEDVHEAARAFTGYRIDRATAKVSHNRRRWDDGEKTLFTHTGKFDGPQVIDLIFDRPEVASMMAAKIWEYFAGENPSSDVVEALADTFRKSNYEMRPMLKELFLSRRFYEADIVRNQIKSPVQYLVQMLKELELSEVPSGLYVTVSQRQLGQVLFAPPNVAGWDWGKAWINTNTLLARYNIAGVISKGSAEAPQAAVAGGGSSSGNAARKTSGKAMMDKAMAEKAGAKGNAKALAIAARNWKGPDYEKIAPRELRSRHSDLVDSLILRFFQGPVPEIHRKRFIAFAEEQEGVVFTNHEIAGLVHLMLSTPQYQLA